MDTVEAQNEKKVRGRPWPKGTSGNAGGGNGLRKLRAALFADMAGLRPKDRALLEQAVAMLWKARRTESAETMKWTRGTMIVPLSFRSGMRSSAPAKPLAELTTDDRRALYLASIGRSYRREW
jgi:hypothetical protein